MCAADEATTPALVTKSYLPARGEDGSGVNGAGFAGVTVAYAKPSRMFMNVPEGSSSDGKGVIKGRKSMMPAVGRKSGWGTPARKETGAPPARKSMDYLRWSAPTRTDRNPDSILEPDR